MKKKNTEKNSSSEKFYSRMDKQQKNSNSGFLLGMFVGIIITLLLVTKNGRKILNILIEEGKDKVSGWDKLLKEFRAIADEEMLEGIDGAEVVTATKAVEDDEYTDGVSDTQVEYISQKEVNTEMQPQTKPLEENEQSQKTDVPQEKPLPRRRLFRGIRRKS